MIFWLLVIVLVVAAVAWFARATGSASRGPFVGRRSSGLDVLEERYARGEINRDEYLEKKRDMLG